MSDEVNKVPVYAEPDDIDYIIIKVKGNVINGDRGVSLYEATRRAWRAKLESAMPYKYVLSVVGGIVKEVYHVLRWYTSPTEAPRIEFDGEVAEFSVRNLFIGKMIPERYRQKGLASPFLYKKKAAATTVDSAPTEEPLNTESLEISAAKMVAEEREIESKTAEEVRLMAETATRKAKFSFMDLIKRLFKL